MNNWFRRFLCWLDMHGPDWGGHGLRNAGPSNSIIGPGHRRCTHCGAEWLAYEVHTTKPYCVMAWARMK